MLKPLRLKKLVNDINKNRYRIKSIVTWLMDHASGDKDDTLPVLQALKREELLSYMKLENLDLSAISQIINDTIK